MNRVILVLYICILTIYGQNITGQESRPKTQLHLEGYIYDAKTNEILPGAHIYSLNKQIGTHTNENGYFRFRFIPDEMEIRISSVGYNDKKMVFSDIKKDTLLHIYLERSATPLQEITVKASKGEQKVQSSQMGATALNQVEIKNIPTVFGEADIVKAIQTQAGVSPGIEGFAGMYVRGGNDDENLFMIDGHPLYQVNHLAGLFSSFNVETIDNITFYKSAFPARYGGRLSSVMDIQTKSGDLREHHGSATVGLTSMNLNWNGPLVKDKTSLLVSMRRSWLELLSVPALAIMNNKEKSNGRKVVGNYSFMDLNVKLDHHFNQKSSAYLLFYYGLDHLKVGEKLFSTTEKDYYKNEDINKLNWGNILTAARWKYKFSNTLSMELSTAYTHYASTLKQNVNNEWGVNQNEPEIEYINKSVKNGIDDISIRAGWTFLPSEKHHINWGINYIHHNFRPETANNTTTDESILMDIVNTDDRIHANELAAYIEDDWSVATFLRVHAGLRLSNFYIQNKSYINLEPRLSTRFLLNRDLSLKASYSRMNQYVQQISDSYISLPTDFWMPINKNFRPLVSDQVALGLYYTQNNEYAFSVEGYYKWMDNLLEYKDGYNMLPSSATWDEKLTSGKGTAYGIDFTAEKYVGKIKGSLNYGLLWTDREFSEINFGRNFPAKYDNRHKLNLTATYPIKENMEITGSWVYMTGNRITLSLENYQDLPGVGFPSDIAPSDLYHNEWGINHFDSKNNVRLPAYHRLDVGLNIYKPKKNNRLAIWNISVYNLYSRMNPIVVQKNTKYTGKGNELISRFQTVSIFPIIPSVSYTYKF